MIIFSFIGFSCKHSTKQDGKSIVKVQAVMFNYKSGKSIEVVKGEQLTIDYRVIPENATYKSVTFEKVGENNNFSIVNSKKGIIQGLNTTSSDDNVKIRISSDSDPTKTATATVKVIPIPVSEVVINEKDIIDIRKSSDPDHWGVEGDDEIEIHYTLFPETAEDKSVTASVIEGKDNLKCRVVSEVLNSEDDTQTTVYRVYVKAVATGGNPVLRITASSGKYDEVMFAVLDTNTNNP